MEQKFKVGDYKKKENMARSKRPRYPERFKKKMVRLYEGGMSLYEIEKAYGCSDGSVWNWSKQYGNKSAIETAVEVVKSPEGKEKVNSLVEKLTRENKVLKATVAELLKSVLEE